LVNLDTYIADMAKTAAATPSDLIAQRVHTLMKGRGWKVTDLAERCKDAGMPSLSPQTLYKMLGQRSAPDRPPRPVSVDELLILSYVLDVAPVHLIAGLDDDTPLPVSPEWTVSASGGRQWIRGLAPMAGGDKKRYNENVPPSEANTEWLPISDVTSYEQVVEALEGFKLFVSLKKQMQEGAGGGQ
jgi:hypothetical protein